MSIKHDKLLLFLITKKGKDFLVIFLKNDFKKLIIQVDRTLCTATDSKVTPITPFGSFSHKKPNENYEIDQKIYILA